MFCRLMWYNNVQRFTDTSILIGVFPLTARQGVFNYLIFTYHQHKIIKY